MTDRDTHHYTTKELYIKGYEEHEFEECAKMTCSATSQIDYTIENMTFQKAQKKQIKISLAVNRTLVFYVIDRKLTTILPRN